MKKDADNSTTKVSERKGIEHISSKVSEAAGSNVAIIGAVSVIIIWAVLGPILHFSNAWQLVINTTTSIVTFLMVFLIQKAQNKDALAIQIKLNELIASSKFASNMIVNVEDLTEDELKTLNQYYSKLADLTRKDPKATPPNVHKSDGRINPEKGQSNS